MINVNMNAQGGYARQKKGLNYALTAKKSLGRKFKTLMNAKILNRDYRSVEVQDNSVVYCDPPYEGTTRYKEGFDHDFFWKWCEKMVSLGHKVFVSEYNAPENWTSIWEKEVTTGLDVKTSKKDVEKLFILNSE